MRQRITLPTTQVALGRIAHQKYAKGASVSRAALARPQLDAAQLRRAAAALRDFQPLSRVTRCAHAAASSDPHGRLILVREDVGSHNALDKAHRRRSARID